MDGVLLIKSSNNKFGYAGVAARGKSSFSANHQGSHLGTFPTIKEAAFAYSKEAKKTKDKKAKKKAEAAPALKTYHVTITNFSKEIVEVKAKDEEEAEEKALAGNIVKEIAIGDPSQECEVQEVGKSCTQTRARSLCTF